MKFRCIFLLFTAYFIVDCARIEQNGYKEVTISFSEKFKRAEFDFVKFKEVLTKASELLFNASRKRAYFEEFVLAIPSTWSDTGDICDRNVAAPKNIDMYVTDSSGDPTLTTRHSRGCGEKGDVMYLPVHWLTGEAKDLALQFVQQWSIFRYGVFPENPETNGSCIATGDSTWSPTGCYNIDFNAKVRFDENNGLPLCSLPTDQKELENLRSSIMFSSNTSKMLDFCDGSDTLPHNSISPTLHNRICEGKAVWSIIKNTEDFRYGRNSPQKDAKAPPNIPIFSCFKETKTRLTLVVQDSDSEARNEIRYSLFHFLSIMEPTEFIVDLVVFSNDTLTKSTSPVEIDLQDKEKLKTLLDSQLKLNEEVPNICLSCGLRKAYQVSSTSYSRRVIFLIARESSLKNTITSEFVEVVESDASVVLYIAFLIEDTATDIIPSALEDAVQNSGGQIFRVKNKAVYMLTEINVALLEATKNALHIEDKILVVYKKAHPTMKSEFSDSFMIPKAAKGKFFYSLQCEKRGDITSVNNICTDKDERLQSPVCGNEVDITTKEDSEKIWTYDFKYGGNKGTTCLSLALLKLQSSSTIPFTVKGWLNGNKIIPGQNALIIYAEIFDDMKQNIQVGARISGPGLDEFFLQLRDNGNGDPDIIKGDNIYSRYFTSFTQQGTYIVSIYAEAQVAEGNYTYFAEKLEKVTRTQTKTIGTFTVMQPPPTEDIYPPNRVSDLRVVKMNNTNSKKFVLLQWTAPGDDYDYGKATKYIIKLSKHWTYLMDFTFNLKENVLLKTDDYIPSNSGLSELVTVHCPLCNDNATYYIALQATDDNNNKGRISNIVQVYFKEASFPPDNGFETSSEPPINSKLTTSFTTEAINFTLSDENTTAISEQETKDSIFIEKNIIIIFASAFGAFLLILIIINIIVCCCCFKKKQSKEPKKISRTDSLKPPYNINVTYKRGSETSLEEENVITHSLNELVHLNSISSSSGETSQQEKRYSYHTNDTLKKKMNSQNRKNDLGFKIVQPMPAYATSSLSRFTARQNDTHDENQPNVQELSRTANDACVYSLGQV